MHPQCQAWTKTQVLETQAHFTGTCLHPDLFVLFLLIYTHVTQNTESLSTILGSQKEVPWMVGMVMFEVSLSLPIFVVVPSNSLWRMLSSSEKCSLLVKVSGCMTGGVSTTDWRSWGGGKFMNPLFPLPQHNKFAQMWSGSKLVKILKTRNTSNFPENNFAKINFCQLVPSSLRHVSITYVNRYIY
jgi:hypothetical protein